MSRNKENNPLPQRPPAISSVFIGKNPTPPSAQFYTDSLIDDDTSRIPTPTHARKKSTISNSRRAHIPSKSFPFPRDSRNAARVAAAHDDVKQNGIRHEAPAPVLRRPLSMRSSQSDLITPPQSRDGPDAVKSPMSEAPSPGQDLADVYQQIYEESILAEDDRDNVSSESDGADAEYRRMESSPSRAPQCEHRSASRDRVTESPAVRAVRSVARPNEADKENFKDEHTAALSEGSGISFLNQLTDQNLAAKITPFVSTHEKDIRRLRYGISDRPISFHAGMKPSEFIAQEKARSDASSDHSSRSSRRRPQRLNSPIVNGAPKAYSDTTLERKPRASQSPVAERNARHQHGRSTLSQSMRGPLRELDTTELERVYSEPAALSDDDAGNVTSPELRRRQRQFETNKARKNLGMGSEASENNDDTQQSAPGGRSMDTRQDERAVDQTEDFDEASMASFDNRTAEVSAPISDRPVPSNAPHTDKGDLRKWQRSAADQRNERRQSIASHASSAVDWAGVDADDPVQSIERDERIDNDTTGQASSPRPRLSFDRLRKLDNEPTGMSFQVSESPPVKARKSSDDLAREREIDQLSRQAVTKSRLEAIRERSPWEAEKKLSRSPSGSSLRKSTSNELRKSISNDAAKDQDTGNALGEQIPDTPIVVFRSSTGSSGDAARSDHDRRASHDALQRFARLSATPKSSPSITPKLDQPASQEAASELVVTTDAPQPKKPALAATPKVIGAWQDTVLPPDTVNTVKSYKPQPKYTQTPHVNAGGWIDTPLPEAAASNAQPAIGRSALTNIIAAQRAKDSNNTNDTLNLGETTIASLEDLVDLNEEDMTTLIRMGAEHEALRQSFGDLSALSHDNNDKASGVAANRDTDAEIVVLDRLSKKLHTLQANIRHARKAASRFEREMSEGGGSVHGDDDLAAPLSATTPTDNIPVTAPTKIINPTGVLPMALTPLRIPLPLLFRPSPSSPPSTTTSTTKGNKSRTSQLTSTKRRFATRFSRPTPLMWVLLILFTWRFVDTAISEFYGHPLYAESYSWPGVDLAVVDRGGKGHGGGANAVDGAGWGVPDVLAQISWDGIVNGIWDGVGGLFGEESGSAKKRVHISEQSASVGHEDEHWDNVLSAGGWSMDDDEAL
ncbi:uncharacterized protein AB675_1860 [Cyphellophora attinorum]|uniref:Uncharacterized protein n=1 Tax=Cyphellophora attinorum TaxID=1664694 RepID=A0A0N0NPT8_9EURO|nr:uncharacterized protein AB675_1860 [Phialophora attinorum]KPI43108.1 hypothetical protein AB675_1860 [Phialophora attinorum]